MTSGHDDIKRTLASARRTLLAARVPAGQWEGELSASALSTATAVCALAMSNAEHHSPEFHALIRKGVAWLSANQNDDGGWGDTVDSPSNISTTTSCWAALGACEQTVGLEQTAKMEQAVGLEQAIELERTTIQRCEAWLKGRAKGLSPKDLSEAIIEVYGKDRTFSVPILTMCALAGRFGKGREAWSCIPSLPFELAVLPHSWFSFLGLPVVSYALPALIAIGQARHHHLPTRNPLTRFLRSMARKKTLRVLEGIQPSSGGFLEAAPLTSFVCMSLASIGQSRHRVSEQGLAFLVESARSDGSWPIDTNLAIWLTTLSLNAMAGGQGIDKCLAAEERKRLLSWLLDQQFKTEHPYTHAAPGGWAWTNLPGGVPDADDTAGTLIALRHLSVIEDVGLEGVAREDVDLEETRSIRDAALAGVRWLIDLQNKDGGIPTFCRGWGKMPFDRSTPDLTAHTLRAWLAWRDHLPSSQQERIVAASQRAIRFLLRSQRADGAWVPLWFGNQGSPHQENPLYGTTRVVLAAEIIRDTPPPGDTWETAICNGVQYILSIQNSDGGWGGGHGAGSSVEETALAIESLASMPDGGGEAVSKAISCGCDWLIEHTEHGTRFRPSPIGLYFARLWYFEQLYPVIFTVAALERIVKRLT